MRVVAPIAQQAGVTCQPLQDVGNLMEQPPAATDRHSDPLQEPETKPSGPSTLGAGMVPQGPPQGQKQPQPLAAAPKMLQCKLTFDGKVKKPMLTSEVKQVAEQQEQQQQQQKQAQQQQVQQQQQQQQGALTEAQASKAALTAGPSVVPTPGTVTEPSAALLRSPLGDTQPALLVEAQALDTQQQQQPQDAPAVVEGPNPAAAAPSEVKDTAGSKPMDPAPAIAKPACKSFSIFMTPAERRKFAKEAKEGTPTPAQPSPQTGSAEHAAEGQGTRAAGATNLTPPAMAVNTVQATPGASVAEGSPAPTSSPATPGEGMAGSPAAPSASDAPNTKDKRARPAARKPRKSRLSQPAAPAASDTQPQVLVAGPLPLAPATQDRQPTPTPGVGATPPLELQAAVAPSEPPPAAPLPQGPPQPPQPKPRMCSIFIRPDDRKQMQGRLSRQGSGSGTDPGSGTASPMPHLLPLVKPPVADAPVAAIPGPGVLDQGPGGTEVWLQAGGFVAEAEGSGVHAEVTRAGAQLQAEGSGPGSLVADQQMLGIAAAASIHMGNAADESKPVGAASGAIPVGGLPAPGAPGASAAAAVTPGPPAAASVSPVKTRKRRSGRPSKTPVGAQADAQGTPLGQYPGSGAGTTPGPDAPQGPDATPPLSGPASSSRRSQQRKPRRASRTTPPVTPSLQQTPAATPDVIIVTPGGREEAMQEGPLVLDLSLSQADLEDEQGPAKRHASAPPATQAPKGPVPSMFFSVAERKRLQQEERRKQQEQAEAAERAAAEEAAAADVAAAAAAAEQAPAVAKAPARKSMPSPEVVTICDGGSTGDQVSNQQQQAAGDAASAPAPVNPFFTKRRVSGARPGVAGKAEAGTGAVASDEGSGQGGVGCAKRPPLGAMLPPVHVQQLPPAPVATPVANGADRILEWLLASRLGPDSKEESLTEISTRVSGQVAGGVDLDPGAALGMMEGAKACAAPALARLRKAAALEQQSSSLFAAPLLAASHFWPPGPWPRTMGSGSMSLACPPGTGFLGSSDAAGQSDALRELAVLAAAEAAAGSSSQTDPELMDVATADDLHQQLQQQVSTMLVSEARGRSAESAADGPMTERSGQAQPRQQQVLLPWAQQYQPCRSSDVCGNTGNVQQLHAWLQAWQTRMATEVRQTPAAGTGSPLKGGRGGGSGRGGRQQRRRRRSSDFIVNDSESEDWSDASRGSDSDGGSRATSRGSDNAIALSGPPGCGKTAAVYACAQELGLEVLEVNASSDRTGAQLLRLVGEATQSRRLAHLAQSQQATAQPDGKVAKTQTAAAAQKALFARKEVASKPRPKRKTISDDSDSPSPVKGRKPGKRVQPSAPPSSAPAPAPAPPSASGRNTLILFEGADLLLDEDRGFLSVLCELIEESKRPVVLLINAPELPGPLATQGIQLLHLQRPSRPELIKTLALTCAAETTRRQQQQQQPLDGSGSCQPSIPALRQPSLAELEQVVDACGGDLRACLHTAQLWLSRPTVPLGPASGHMPGASCMPDLPEAAAAAPAPSMGPVGLCCSDAAAYGVPGTSQALLAMHGGSAHGGSALAHRVLHGHLALAEAHLAACLQRPAEGEVGRVADEAGRQLQGSGCSASGTDALGDASRRGMGLAALAALRTPPGGSLPVAYPAWPLLGPPGANQARSREAAGGLNAIGGLTPGSESGATSGVGQVQLQQPQDQLAGSDSFAFDGVQVPAVASAAVNSASALQDPAKQTLAAGSHQLAMEQGRPGSGPDGPEACTGTLPFDPLLRQNQLAAYHEACTEMKVSRLTLVCAQQAAWRQATVKANKKTAQAKRGQRSGRASLVAEAEGEGEEAGRVPDGEAAEAAAGKVAQLETDGEQATAAEESGQVPVGDVDQGAAGVVQEVGALAVDAGMAVDTDPLAKADATMGVDAALPPAVTPELHQDAPMAVNSAATAADAAAVEQGMQPAGAVGAPSAVMQAPSAAATPMAFASADEDSLQLHLLSPTAMEGVIDSPVQQRTAAADAEARVGQHPSLRGPSSSGLLLQTLFGSEGPNAGPAMPPAALEPPPPPPPLRYPASERASAGLCPRPVPLDRNPGLATLLLMADAHDLLSQAAMLAGAMDSAPLSTGGCTSFRNSSGLPNEPLVPGRNMALAWGGAVRRARFAGDALRDPDGAHALACCDDLVQDELRRGARRPLEGASAGAAGGIPSVAQQAATELAGALLRAVASDQAARTTALGPGSHEASMAPELLLHVSTPSPSEYYSWRVPQANSALLCMSLRTAGEGAIAAIDRVAAAAQICRLEAVRQLEGARLVGRVRRVPRFRHHLQEACPEVDEAVLHALLQLSSFGPVSLMS